MKATIIGSQPVKEMPAFPFENSYGLNHAAIKYETQYAFTGHKEWYDQFTGLKVIGIRPTFEGESFKVLHDVIKFDAHNSRSVDYQPEMVEKFVKSAIKCEDIGYPNRFTILHLAMFYVMKKGFKEIEILGCANNYDQFNQYNHVQISRSAHMRRFTSLIIKYADMNGVKFNWVKLENAEEVVPPVKVMPDMRVLNIKGYFQKHFELCMKHKTQQDAYDELETIYKRLTGVNRYSSYDAFRNAKTRFYKVNR